MVTRSANRSQQARAAPPPAHVRRKWTFRIAAILLGFLPLFVVELVLRSADWPAQSLPLDPYLDLHNLRPLFHSSAETGVLEIPQERLHFFNPTRFTLAKPADGFRVFALGGSTTFGEPYTAPTSFPKWLEINLQAAAPERSVEVINCGGLSYASYRVLAILREVLQYEPDLVVLYTGHNEYLERRSYGDPQQWRPLATVGGWTSQLRIVQALRLATGSSTTEDLRVSGNSLPTTSDKTAIASEVDALLDYRGGLEEYQRGAEWMARVPEHFEWNLRAMETACRSAGVPLLIVKPVSNLRDCPPFKMEPAPGLDEIRASEFESAWQSARETQDVSESLEELEKALKIDPQHAGVNFLLGRRLLETGALPEVGESAPTALALARARDFDVCPLRAPSALLQAIDRVTASGQQIPVVDADQLFRTKSPHGIVGDEWLVDHIHPSIEGHQLLGQTIAERVIQSGWLTTTINDWQGAAESAAREHLATLGEAYFHHGQQRLQGLRLWTQGRAKKVRGPENE